MRRTTFFLLLSLVIISPFFIYKLIWLSTSVRTYGIMGFEGMGYAGDQIRLDYSCIYFRLGKDSIWFNGMGNYHFPVGKVIPVRYRPSNPTDARIDMFAAIWGDTLIYSGIPMLMLLVIFIHRHVVPRRSKILLSLTRPFIHLERLDTDQGNC